MSIEQEERVCSCGCKEFWFSRTEPMGYYCEKCGKRDGEDHPFNQDYYDCFADAVVEMQGKPVDDCLKILSYALAQYELRMDGE